MELSLFYVTYTKEFPSVVQSFR